MAAAWIAALVGLALRALAARAQGTFWFDEAFSAHFAAMPLGQGLPLLIRDVHPTLYYLVLHFWMMLFGTGEAAVRTLSVITGALAAVGCGSLAKRVFGSAAGAVAAFLVALSPLLVFQSAEARMYPLLILLVSLQAAEFLKLQDEPGRPAWRWAAFSTLALFTHLTAATPFAVMAGYRLWQLRHDRRRLAGFAAMALLATVPFFAWLGLAAAARAGSVGREWQLSLGGLQAPLSWHFTAFFANDAAPWLRAFILAALLACTLRALFEVRRDAAALAWRLAPNPDRRAWLLAALALLPFLAFVGVTTAVTKYFEVAIPAAAALAAGGFARFLPDEPRQRRLALALAAALWSAAVLPSLASLAQGQRIRYDEAARFIERRERPGDMVYASWFPTLLPLGRQYRGQLPLYAANPYEGEISYDEALVLHAGQSLTAADLEKAESMLESRATRAGRVFLVTGAAGPNSTPIERWFFQRGWALEETYQSNSWSPVVYQLRNPKPQEPALP